MLDLKNKRLVIQILYFQAVFFEFIDDIKPSELKFSNRL